MNQIQEEPLPFQNRRTRITHYNREQRDLRENIQSISAAFATIRRVTTLLRNSAKRSELFKAAVEVNHPNNVRTVLPRLL